MFIIFIGLFYVNSFQINRREIVNNKHHDAVVVRTWFFNGLI